MWNHAITESLKTETKFALYQISVSFDNNRNEKCVCAYHNWLETIEVKLFFFLHNI